MNAETQASRDALNANLAVYNQNRQDNYGGLVTGNSALQTLAKLYGLDYYNGVPSYQGITATGGERSSSTTPMQFGTGGGNSGSGGGGGGNVVNGTGVADYSSFFMGPDYQVKLDGGLQGYDRSAAARGGLYSGRHAADLTDYAGNMASSAFGDYKNTLLNLAGYGTQANNAVANAGSQFGSSASNAMNNIGNARSSGYMNQGDIWGNTANNLSSMFGSAFGNQQGSGGSSWTPTIGPGNTYDWGF